MDRDLLARKLYGERVSRLANNQEIDEDTLTELWESKANPAEAAKSITEDEQSFEGPAWLSRYLNR
ncbi:hypothetical protein L3Q72_03935 [Vibrio sp. JC009]|uniref:hypothetical protein n=1 Tax=Vibrio sp. JC009 TaxID=2912314 RepID=UPI0023AFE1FD|nr:hypothetical protein [Vibrio sp. JC009]WED22554.1 hypothetical protein L3Q72_03935 [Vibrio sp. JC009]